METGLVQSQSLPLECHRARAPQSSSRNLQGEWNRFLGARSASSERTKYRRRQRGQAQSKEKRPKFSTETLSAEGPCLNLDKEFQVQLRALDSGFQTEVA